jgi:hypothetical protein
VPPGVGTLAVVIKFWWFHFENLEISVDLQCD